MFITDAGSSMGSVGERSGEKNEIGETAQEAIKVGEDGDGCDSGGAHGGDEKWMVTKIYLGDRNVG